MKTQHDIIQAIWATAKVLEQMTAPPMLEVEPYDIPLRDAAHSYARRLEMQADAWTPDTQIDGNSDAWHRVEHAARRLASTLRDIEETAANRVTRHAAIALADHCRDEAQGWRKHPIGPEPDTDEIDRRTRAVIRIPTDH